MVIMDRGRIVADGPTSDLMGDPALLAAHGLELPWMPGVMEYQKRAA
jgi:hypothetical protein